MIAVSNMELHPYALPFAQPLPARARPMTHRRGWLVALDDDAGRRGWGDAAPWPGFASSDEEVAAELGELHTSAALSGVSFADEHDVWRWLEEQRFCPEVRFAIELALLDLIGQARSCTIASLLGPDAAGFVATHALVTGATDPLASVLKLKIGADIDAAEARVAEVRAAARAGARLRLDAGGAFDEALACRAIDRLARYGVEWLEVADASARVRAYAKARGVKIALDVADVEAALAVDAADVYVLKPMFVGGLRRTLALVERIQAAGREAIVTNALESAIGRTGVVHLAAVLPGVHGLGSALARDLADAPSRRGDRIACPAGAGLGVAPRHARIESGATDGIPHPLASAALARPDHPAIVTSERKLSYRELCDAVARAAGALCARGIGPQSTVALRGPRSIEWVIAFHAIGWLGAAAAPLADEAPEPERARYLEALRPSAVLDAGPLEGPPLAERFWPLGETRLVLPTSGTSGAPRPVALTTQQLLLSAFGSAMRLGHAPEDRWLCCLPLHHVAGASILMRCAFYATTVVLHERFDARRVAFEDATLVSLVPAMLERVLDVREELEVRAVLLGGAPPSPELLARLGSTPVAFTWGMTEAASQVATSFVGENALVPLAFVRVENSGERLALRGPLVGGELVTNDRGHVDEGGVHIHGRADSVIVSGGEKIDPREIERVLEEHPAIAEAAVVGLRNATWGERPVAVLVPRGDAMPSRAEVKAFCRARLAAFKAPDDMVWCTRLPKSALGKVSRAHVRELARDVLGDERASAQPIDQRGRGSNGLEAIERHESMNQRGARAHFALRSAKRVGEANGALRQALDLELDVDPLVHAKRFEKVGFGVNQRHTDALAVDEPVDAAADLQHELLEGGVAVLEDATEEGDARAIDLVETNRHPMNERHGDDRQ